MTTATASIAAAAASIAAAPNAFPGRHETPERAITYTYVPAWSGGVSIVKTYGIPVESPALRGAIAWAMRRPGRQIEFSARSNRAIGFEQD